MISTFFHDLKKSAFHVKTNDIGDLKVAVAFVGLFIERFLR